MLGSSVLWIIQNSDARARARARAPRRPRRGGTGGGVTRTCRHASSGITSERDSGRGSCHSGRALRRPGTPRLTGRQGSSKGASRTTAGDSSSARWTLNVGSADGSTPSNSPSDDAASDSAPELNSAAPSASAASSNRGSTGSSTFGRAVPATPEDAAASSAPTAPAPAESSAGAGRGCHSRPPPWRRPALGDFAPRFAPSERAPSLSPPADS